MDSQENLQEQFASLYNSKNYDELITLLEKLGIDEKSDITLLYYAGLAYSKKEKMLDKAVYFLENVQYASKNMLFHVQSAIALAYLYIKKEQFTKAFTLLDSVVQSGISNSYVHALIGYVCIKRNDFSKASKHYKISIELDEDNMNAINGLASSYIEMNTDLDEALELAKKATEMEPDNISFLDTLAMVYYKLKQYDLAKDNIKKAMSIDPENMQLKDNFELIKRKIRKPVQ